ncbi:MAG: hypothetical protein ACI87N_000029, partial [Flavobacteriales bacterium]
YISVLVFTTSKITYKELKKKLLNPLYLCTKNE